MILMNDFKAEPAALREAMVVAVRRVIESGWYVLGEEGRAFERRWTDACGMRHGVGVGNGMDAIEIALRACGIGAGDEVITTPMTAFATVLAILRAGAVPVLADVEPGTALLSLESVQRCISARTKAVVLVHLYGQVRHMTAWTALCRQTGLRLIEDCAQAHLACSAGQMAGSFGDAAAFSFYPTKNLGALGDAGMMLTNDSEIAALAAQLRNYGQTERYHHGHLGMNSRLDEVHAAMLLERLRWLAGFTSRRQQIAASYRAQIHNAHVRHLLPPEDEGAHVYHLYVLCSPQRDQLQRFLAAKGIQTFIHYPVPMHHQQPCAAIGRDPNGLPCAEQHAQECLSIPCHPQLDDLALAQVIDAVNDFQPD